MLSVNQHSTQISTRPRATKQGCVKCRSLYHFSGPNTGSNPEGGRIQKKSIVQQSRKLHLAALVQSSHFLSDLIIMKPFIIICLIYLAVASSFVIPGERFFLNWQCIFTACSNHTGLPIQVQACISRFLDFFNCLKAIPALAPCFL